jgi:ribonuclease Y
MESRSLWSGLRRSGSSPANPAPPQDEAQPDDADAELQARRETIARMEEEALRETQSLEIQTTDLERRAQTLDDRERNVAQQTEELKRAKRVQRRELERISGLTAAQAKELLLADVEKEARHQAGLRLVELDDQTKREAERRARSILSVAMQRLASRHSSDSTTRLVELPSDEMKGRIIGRDGRNIRALEHLTGVDVIIDETPNAVLLSSFDGVRREVARITLERLVADGRITPSSIEETYEHVKEEIDARIVEEGERAALEAHVSGLDPRLVELLGQLRFRTSYGQNVLDHLVECANLAALIAGELGANVETARRAALLHDIGKAVGHEVDGTHAAVGARIAQRQGESEAVAHAIAAHHSEVEPKTVEAVVVQATDAISGARPGARGEALEEYVSRLRDLEDIASRHPGVERVLAMRAGREVRVIVDPGQVDDEAAALIAHEAAAAIEKEVPHPGRIKVTVIRESRASAWAD